MLELARRVRALVIEDRRYDLAWIRLGGFMAWKGWENFTPNGAQEPAKKGSKYHNKAYVLDGIRFDSQHEAQRWYELKQQQKAGLIFDLRRQVPFDLTTLSRDERTVQQRGFQAVGRYVADFVYRDEYNAMVVEDAKGVRTDIYKWKKRHFEIEYGIKIKEV